MSTPANYYTKGEPADLDPSNVQTNWYNQLNIKISEITKATTNSTAMSLSIATHNPKRKDKHYWPNWAEFLSTKEQTKKDCMTLTPEARDTIKETVCKHITKFSSYWRRLAV